MPDFDELGAGLRSFASVHDASLRGAVDLMIWQETLLRRADFFAAAIAVERNGYRIRWDRAEQWAETAVGATSQFKVLKLAAWIATDPLGLNGFGHAHRRAAVDAFAAALGVTSLSAEASDA